MLLQSQLKLESTVNNFENIFKIQIGKPKRKQ